MKIIDTTTYFEENMMMDIRFNILNSYVDKFIVCESLYSHSGKKKNINFNADDYPKFKNKIIHLILKKEPDDLIKNENLSIQEKRFNSVCRIKDQRNYIKTCLNQFSPEDFIIYSDNDEIPNLTDIDFNTIKKKFIIFNQQMYYYKFNLKVPNLNWYGSKACKLKHLQSIDFLRNIKNRSYPYFRIDTLFSDSKQNSVGIVKNGGWHFSNLKNAADIEFKLKSYLHHIDYRDEELGLDKINYLIKNNKTIYDMFGDKSSKKFGDEKRETLEKYEIDKLPMYIQNNLTKFKEWID